MMEFLSLIFLVAVETKDRYMSNRVEKCEAI